MLARRWKSVFRGDSGYHNERAFDLFSEHAAEFFIKSPMSASRLNLAQTSTELVWGPEENGVSHASYMTKTKQGTVVREIYKRTRQTHPEGQMSLLSSASFRYDCVSTNDLVVDEALAFSIYNKRAHIENAIKELKEDYHLGHIVTDSFDANDALTQATMLAYSMIQLLKNEALPPKMGRMRLSTLRTHVFNVPACLVHWARREITRIQNVFLPPEKMAMITSRVRRLASWMLDPPLIEEPAA